MLLHYQHYEGILCPSPSDIGGKIIFLRGSFALCPRVFPTLREHRVHRSGATHRLDNEPHNLATGLLVLYLTHAQMHDQKAAQTTWLP